MENVKPVNDFFLPAQGINHARDFFFLMYKQAKKS